MAKMTVQDFHNRIREIIDLEVADLSDALLNLFLTQGMRYTQRYNQGLWPQYEYTWTVALTSGTRDYTFGDLEAGDTNSYTIAVIRDIRSDDRSKFIYMDRGEFDVRFARDITTAGPPYVWNLRDSDTVRFFPEPDTNVTVDVLGWREATNWVDEGTAGTSDLPEDFDDPILAYAMGQVYAQQDEGQTAVFWLNMADVHLIGLEDKYDASVPTDMAMNERPSYLWRPETPGRPPFNFEF